MPDRNEHPPEEVARLAQVLSGGFAAPRSLLGDKLRLQKWLAAHPSCEYPIVFSIAVFHAAGVATDNLPPGTSIEKYAGLLFRGMWRNGSLPNCKPDRVRSTNLVNAWSFVQFAGTTVGTHAMATLLSCIDHMTAVDRRLIDGCIASAIISTAEELAAMNTLVKSITLFPLAYDALRTTTPWATVAAEEGLKTLLASLLHAARAGALIVSDMEFDLDYGGLQTEVDDDEEEEKNAAAAAAPPVVEQREENGDHSSNPFGGLRAASGRFATAEAVAAQVAEYFARHRELESPTDRLASALFDLHGFNAADRDAFKKLDTLGSIGAKGACGARSVRKSQQQIDLLMSAVTQAAATPARAPRRCPLHLTLTAEIDVGRKMSIVEIIIMQTVNDDKTGGWKTKSGVCGVCARVCMCVRACVCAVCMCVCVRACVRVRRRSPSGFTHPPLHPAPPAPPAPPSPPPPSSLRSTSR